MKENLKRLYGKKGVTLVELIVVMAITTIIFAIAIGMLMPVTNLMNSIKGNAHMDSLCDTVNEYIRSSLDKAVDASILVYPDAAANWTDDYQYELDAQEGVKAAWKDFADKYKVTDGYQLRAIGIIQNYNNDFRLYDFGDVSRGKINYTWGAKENGGQDIVLNDSNDGSDIGNTFWQLLNFRDGGGRDRSWETPPRSGVNGNEFGLFSAFNDSFYSNGLSGNANYSIQVAFEAADRTLDDGSKGINYFTISTQVFKRTGDAHSSDPEEKNVTFEPANQVKSLSFKMMNGNASLQTTFGGKINKVEDVDGVKQIMPGDRAAGKSFSDSVVILYVVKTYSSTPTPTPTP